MEAAAEGTLETDILDGIIESECWELLSAALASSTEEEERRGDGDVRRGDTVVLQTVVLHVEGFTVVMVMGCDTLAASELGRTTEGFTMTALSRSKRMSR